MTDFAGLPPEINSTLIYTGPGASPMLAAAQAWDSLAAELSSAATGYRATLTSLSATWAGPSFAAMLSSGTAYASWLTSTAATAERTATAARVAAAAYQAARTASVPPAVVAANRAQLAALVATNLLGQNAAAIAANEAAYAAMWAQDTAAMAAYSAAASSATGTLTAPTDAPQTATAAPAASTIDLSPSGWLGQIAIAVLGSGPWQAPTNVLSLLTGLWAVSEAAELPAILNRVHTAIEAPAPAVIPTATPSTGARVTIRAGAGGRVGVLSVPPSWAQQLPTTSPRATAPIAAAAEAGAPETLPLPLANLGSLRGSEVAKRQPRYGDTPTVMPKHPHGG